MRAGGRSVSADVLVVVADEALRAVLEIALTMDGCTVRTAADDASGRRALTAGAPDILVLDATTPLPDDAPRWTEHVAPYVPVVVLVPAWDEPPVFNRHDVAVLSM